MPNTVAVGTGPRFPTPAVMYLVEGNLLEQAQRAFTEFIVTTEDTLPPLELQAAWELLDGNILLNRDAAHNIVRARLRNERKPLLDALDVRYMRAIEAGEDTGDIVLEKQVLRDITEVPLDGYTATELATLTLTELLEKSHGS